MSAAQKAGRPIGALLVGGSPSDVRLMQEAFCDVNRLVRLHVAAGGVEAMALLKHWGDHANSARPLVVKRQRLPAISSQLFPL